MSAFQYPHMTRYLVLQIDLHCVRVRQEWTTCKILFVIFIYVKSIRDPTGQSRRGYATYRVMQGHCQVLAGTNRRKLVALLGLWSTVISRRSDKRLCGSQSFDPREIRIVSVGNRNGNVIISAHFFWSNGQGYAACQQHDYKITVVNPDESPDPMVGLCMLLQ